MPKVSILASMLIVLVVLINSLLMETCTVVNVYL